MPMVTAQLSVFLENRYGRTAEVVSLLGDAGVNLKAITLTDTSDFGILRLIVDRPDLGQEVLQEAGFATRETEVIVVGVPDETGGLAKVLRLLKEAAINIEYLYSFIEKESGAALTVFRTDHNRFAAEFLSLRGIKVYGSPAS